MTTTLSEEQTTVEFFEELQTNSKTIWFPHTSLHYPHPSPLYPHPLTQPGGSDAVQWLKLAFSITKDVTESYL